MKYYRLRFPDNKVTVWNNKREEVEILAQKLKNVKIEEKEVDTKSIEEYNRIIKRKRGNQHGKNH